MKRHEKIKSNKKLAPKTSPSNTTTEKRQSIPANTSKLENISVNDSRILKDSRNLHLRTTKESTGNNSSTSEDVSQNVSRTTGNAHNLHTGILDESKKSNTSGRRRRNVSQNVSLSVTDNTLNESEYRAVIGRKRWWDVLEGSVRPHSFDNSDHPDESVVPTDSSLQLSPPVSKKTRQKRLSYGVFERAIASRTLGSPNSVSAYMTDKQQNITKLEDSHEESVETPVLLSKRERLRQRLSKGIFERAIRSSGSPVSSRSSLVSNSESDLKYSEESSPKLAEEDTKRKIYKKRISTSVFKNAIIEEDEFGKKSGPTSPENSSGSESPVIIPHSKKKNVKRKNTIEAFMAEMGHDDNLESPKKRRTIEKTSTVYAVSDSESPMLLKLKSFSKNKSLTLQTFHDSMKSADEIESPIKMLIMDNTLHTDSSSENNIAESMNTRQKKKRIIKRAIMYDEKGDKESCTEKEEDLNNVVSEDMLVEKSPLVQRQTSLREEVEHDILETVASYRDVSESPSGRQQGKSIMDSTDKKNKKRYVSLDTNAEISKPVSVCPSTAKSNEYSLVQSGNISSPKSPTVQLSAKIRRGRPPIRVSAFNISDESGSEGRPSRSDSTSPRIPPVETMIGRKNKVKPPIRISAFNVSDESGSEGYPTRSDSTSPRIPPVETMIGRKNKVKPPIRISAFNVSDEAGSEGYPTRSDSTSPRIPPVETMIGRKNKVKPPIRISAFNVSDEAGSEGHPARSDSTSPSIPPVETMIGRKNRVKPPIRISAFNVSDEAGSEGHPARSDSTSPSIPPGETMIGRKNRVKPPIRISAFNVSDEAESAEDHDRMTNTSPRSPSVQSMVDHKQRSKPPIRISAFKIFDDSEHEEGLDSEPGEGHNNGPEESHDFRSENDTDRITSTSSKSPLLETNYKHKSEAIDVSNTEIIDTVAVNSSRTSSTISRFSINKKPSITASTNNDTFTVADSTQYSEAHTIHASSTTLLEDSRSSLDSIDLLSSVLSHKKVRAKKKVSFTDFEQAMASVTDMSSELSENASENNVNQVSASESVTTGMAHRYSTRASIASHQTSMKTIPEDMEISQTTSNENLNVEKNNKIRESLSAFKKSCIVRHSFSPDLKLQNNISSPTKHSVKILASSIQSVSELSNTSNIQQSFNESEIAITPPLSNRTARSSIAAFKKGGPVRHSFSFIEQEDVVSSDNIVENETPVQNNETSTRPRESLKAFIRQGPVRRSASFKVQLAEHSGTSEKILNSCDASYRVNTPTEESIHLSNFKSNSKIVLEKSHQLSDEISDSSVESLHIATSLAEKIKFNKPSLGLFKDNVDFETSKNTSSILDVEKSTNESDKSGIIEDMLSASSEKVLDEKNKLVVKIITPSKSVGETEVGSDTKNQMANLRRESLKPFVTPDSGPSSDSFHKELPSEHISLSEERLQSHDRSARLTTPTVASLHLSSTQKSREKISLEESRRTIPDFELSDSSEESLHVAASLAEKRTPKKLSLGLFKDLVDFETLNDTSVEETAFESDKESPAEELVPSLSSHELPPIKTSDSVAKDIDTTLTQTATHSGVENHLIQNKITTKTVGETEVRSDTKNQTVNLRRESLKPFVTPDSGPSSDSFHKELPSEHINLSEERLQSHDRSARLTTPTVASLHLSSTQKSREKISLEESRRTIPDFELSDSSEESLHVAASLAEKRTLKKLSLGLFKDLVDFETLNDTSVEETAFESDKESPAEELVPSLSSHELPPIKTSDSVAKDIDTTLTQNVTPLLETSKEGREKSSSRKTSVETEDNSMSSNTVEISSAFTTSEYARAFEIMESNASNVVNDSNASPSISGVGKKTFNLPEFQKALDILDNFYISLDTSSIKDFEISKVLSSTARLSSIKNVDGDYVSMSEEITKSNKTILPDERNKSKLSEASNVISKTSITPLSSTNSKAIMQKSYYRKRFNLGDLKMAIEAARTPDSTVESPAPLTSHRRYSIWDFKKAVTMLQANTTAGGDISNIASFYLTPNRSSTLAKYRTETERKRLQNVAPNSSMSKQSISMSPFNTLGTRPSITSFDASRKGKLMTTAEAMASDHIASVSASEAMASDHVTSVSASEAMARDHIASVSASEAMASDHVTSVSASEAMASDHVTSVSASEAMASDHVTSVSASEASQFVKGASVTEVRHFPDISTTLKENLKIAQPSVYTPSNIDGIDKESASKKSPEKDKKFDNEETSLAVSLESEALPIESANVYHTIAKSREIDMVMSESDTSTVSFHESPNALSLEAHESDLFETHDDESPDTEAEASDESSQEASVSVATTSVPPSYDEATGDSGSPTTEGASYATQRKSLKKTKESSSITVAQAETSSKHLEVGIADDHETEHEEYATVNQSQHKFFEKSKKAVAIASSAASKISSRAVSFSETENKKQGMEKVDTANQFLEKTTDSEVLIIDASIIDQRSSSGSKIENIYLDTSKEEEAITDEEMSVTKASTLDQGSRSRSEMHKPEEEEEEATTDEEMYVTKASTLDQGSRSRSEMHEPEEEEEEATTDEEMYVTKASTLDQGSRSRSEMHEPEEEEEEATTDEEMSMTKEASEKASRATASHSSQNMSSIIQGNFSGIHSLASSSGASEKSLLGSQLSPKSNTLHKNMSKIFADAEKLSSKSTREHTFYRIPQSSQSLRRGTPLDFDNYKQLLDECVPDDAFQKLTRKNKNIPVSAIKTKKTKKSVPPERMFRGVEYRKPKINRKQKWVTERLFKKLEAQFALKSTLRAGEYTDNFIDWLVDKVTGVIRKKSETNNVIKRIAQTLKKEGFVNDDYEFCTFCHDYMPRSFNMKVLCFPREKYLES